MMPPLHLHCFDACHLSLKCQLICLFIHDGRLERTIGNRLPPGTAEGFPVSESAKGDIQFVLRSEGASGMVGRARLKSDGMVGSKSLDGSI